MRVLLSTTSGAGHFRPLLPFARALSKAGHEVACAAPAEARSMVEREGLRHLPFGGVPDGDPERGAVMGRLPTVSADEARHLFLSEIFGRLNTRAALPGVQETVASFGPDLVVHDLFENAARIAAEARGVPHVAVTPSLVHPSTEPSMAAGLVEIRAALGLEPQQPLASPLLSGFPASFDYPAAAARDVHRYRDPQLQLAAGSAGELVYVTLGSEAHSMPFFGAVLRDAVAGALQAGLPVVVSTGADIDADVLGGLEGDLRVERWVDQVEVMSRARAIVCHGGSGSVLGALATGVPLVVVPLFADQPDNAERVEATDTGTRVDPGPDLEARISSAVRRVVADPPQGSAQLAADVAALPVADEAVSWLESLARG